MNFDTVETINLNAGSGNNTINVTGTGPNTNINNGNGGNDTITVTGTGANNNLVINGGAGPNVISLTTTGAGSVTIINGGASADSITVSGTGANSGLQVNGGGGADTITLLSTGTGSVSQLNALATGVGVLFDVQATGTGSVTEINGGAGNDTTNIGGSPAAVIDGIQGAVCFHGNGGSNTLNINDQASATANTYNVTFNSVQRVAPSPIPTAPIFYDTTQFLNVNAGMGPDTVNVFTTSAITTTTVNTGPSPDVINVQTISGPTIVNTGTGGDTVNVSSNAPLNTGTLADIFAALTVSSQGAGSTLNISDFGDPIGRLWTLGRNSLTGTGMAGSITYNNFVTLNFEEGQGNDKLDINDTNPGTTNNLFGEGGNNIFCVMHTSGITNLLGGLGLNDFAFGDGANLSGGTMDGGGGGLLNYTAYTTGVRVNLSSNTSPILLGRGKIAINGVLNFPLDPGPATSATAGGVIDRVLNVETLLGGAGNDTLVGSSSGADNVIEGNGGDNFIVGGFGNNTLLGGNGNDVIQGGANPNAGNLIVGNGGNNTLIGGAGTNTIVGGTGSDTLVAGPHNDILFGGVSPSDVANFNLPRQASKRDLLLGGEGFDIFLITSCNDILNAADIFQFGSGGGRIDLITSDHFMALTSESPVTPSKMTECDPSKVAFATGVITQAALAKNREAVASGVLNSGENRGNLINSYYQQFLGRNADPSGMQHWQGVLAGGGRQEDVIAGILGSDEYYARQGGTDAGFVTALYRDLLGRGLGQSEVAYWVGKLSGIGRGGVAAAILGSDEYRGDLIDSYYQRYFARHVDQSGLQTWLALMAQGATDEEVQARLLASDEYLQRISTQFFDVNRGFISGVYRDVLHRLPGLGEINAWLVDLSAIQ